MSKSILIGHEFSATMRQAFAMQGWDAWSCDLLPTEVPGQHLQCDVFEAIASKAWDMAIFHPTCKYLNRAGWHWVNKPDSDVLPLKGAPRRRAAMEAAQHFRQLLACGIPRIVVENPRPISHVCLPPSSQVIQPW